MLKVEFVGHIGSDAEIKDFNGKRYIVFNVATSERFKDAQGNPVSRTTWVSCLKPGDGAVVNYLKKGTQVYCRGNLTVKTYTGRNGVEAGINCTVSELELLGSRQDAQQNQQPGAASQAYGAGNYGMPPRRLPRVWPRKRRSTILTMSEARTNEVKGVGYVVVWFENYTATPLRAFFSPGAAWEFRKMIENYTKPDKERRIKALAASYDPGKVYNYPEPTNFGIAKLKTIPNGY